MEEYEDKLHLLKNYTLRNQQTDAIQAYVQAKYPADEQLQQLVAGLENLEEE